MRIAFQLLAFIWAASALAGNPILGEIELEAASKLEQNAGVWFDGQYVGYVKDLRGKNKLVALPGEHALLVKLVGYEDVARTIVVDPGGQKQYRVSMRETENLTYPAKEETARVRLSVEPDEAAVFVNGTFAGHVDRFNGRAGMRLATGTYQFTIALPGYRSFDTELSVRAGQDYELRTELAEGGYIDQAVELTADRSRD